MKALTLWQPWSWAIAHAGKRVENRTWAPPASVIGQRVAIHAGLKLDREAASRLTGDLMQRWDPSVPGHHDLTAAVALDLCLKPVGNHPGFVHGAVESVATIAGHVYDDGTIVGANIPGLQDAVESPWFTGPIGWVLDDVVALPEPVPCKGAQGLWTLLADVESAVLAQLARER